MSAIPPPSHVSTLPVSGFGDVPAGPLFALGDLLVITTPKNRAGIATVDISDPLNPGLLDSIIPGPAPTSAASTEPTPG